MAAELSNWMLSTSYHLLHHCRDDQAPLPEPRGGLGLGERRGRRHRSWIHAGGNAAAVDGGRYIRWVGARAAQAVREGAASASSVKGSVHQQSSTSMARTTKTPTAAQTWSRGWGWGRGGGDPPREWWGNRSRRRGSRRGVAAHRHAPLHLGRWRRSWGMDRAAAPAEPLAARSRKNDESPSGPAVVGSSWALDQSTGLYLSIGPGPFTFFSLRRENFQRYVTYLSSFRLWY
jgi:hypothetical protein